MDVKMEELTLPTEELDNTQSKTTNEFYVVSIKKFCLLFFSTLGLYSIYWFYKNWLSQKQANMADCWPAPRGLFYIFFVHSLFRNIDKQLTPERSRYNNDLSSTATLVVVATLGARISSNLSDKSIGSPITDVLCIALTAAVGLLLLKAQKSINLACNDPEGLSNNNLTWLNILWITVGSVLTLFVLIGLAMIVAEAL